MRQPDELRASGRTRRAQEQREVGVDLVVPAMRERRVQIVTHDSDGGRPPGARQVIDVVVGEQRDVAALDQCEVGDDELDRRLSGEHDERASFEVEFSRSPLDAGPEHFE